MERQQYADAFAAVLRPLMPGQSFESEEVGLLNQLAALADKRTPKVAGALTPSVVCERNVQAFEGCARKIGEGRFQAYADPATGGDPWTIGWGSTGAGIRPGLVWTQQQCDERLRADLAKFGAQVAALVKDVRTTQPQFDALVSFAYNVGIGNLTSSTLLKLHRAGDYAGAQAQFARWNKAGNPPKPMAGLTRRRAAEAKLYGVGA